MGYPSQPCGQATHIISTRMNRYAILTNRKRAIIALVHSFFFLLVALMSFLGQPKAGLFFSPTKPAGDWAMLGIYLVVSTILLILVRVSTCARERLYFAFCATSASFGLLRILLGDSPSLCSAVCSCSDAGVCSADRLHHSQAPFGNITRRNYNRRQLLRVVLSSRIISIPSSDWAAALVYRSGPAPSGPQVGTRRTLLRISLLWPEHSADSHCSPDEVRWNLQPYHYLALLLLKARLPVVVSEASPSAAPESACCGSSFAPAFGCRSTSNGTSAEGFSSRVG